MLTYFYKYRYKIHIQVEDNTEKTTFVLFNDVAEKLRDTSAHKLFNKLSSLDNNNFSAHTQSLCWKDFIFKLKLNSYNLKEGLENFTVSKLWIPYEKLELEYKLKKDKKNLIEDEREPKDCVPKELSTEKNRAQKMIVLVIRRMKTLTLMENLSKLKGLTLNF
ncbi:hypothetical protein T459_01801 [Capsicum annuum]|uniref:Replication factor A C-terminal domain-containing protein n=1 Tax=Capsicum annuum TaxID=4072 RepID=A0A2G3AI55_CAPAN|nr:hypothetical protein T459_01801 [Capsicum annuum]